MSDNDQNGDKQGGSFLDELFKLGEETVDFVESVQLKTSSTRAVRQFEPEPIDNLVGVGLRALLDKHGAVVPTKEVDCFRLCIGEGIAMRAYEGSNISGLISLACDGEGVVLPGVKR